MGIVLTGELLSTPLDQFLSHSCQHGLDAVGLSYVLQSVFCMAANWFFTDTQWSSDLFAVLLKKEPDYHRRFKQGKSTSVVY